MTTLIEKLDLNRKINSNISILLFLSGFLYSYFLLIFNKSIDNYTTIAYILSLCFFFHASVKQLNSISILDIVLSLTLLHLGIFLGFNLAQADPQELWVIDSFTMHLPKSLYIVDYLGDLSQTRSADSQLDKIYFTNIIVGLFFKIFYVSPSISGIALLSIKCSTTFIIYLLGKSLENERVAKIACLIYILLPTLTFYSATYYKEVSVHLFLALFFYALTMIKKNLNYQYIILLIIATLGISQERFYLAPISMSSLPLIVIFHDKIKVKFKIAIITMVAACCVIFVVKYSSIIDFENILISLKRLETAYNNYSDVNRNLNSDLIYPLKIIKFMFTPFFTLNKFDMFHNYSYLLIWGSFLNQFIVASALFYFFMNTLNRLAKYWYLLLPMILFFLIFGYIAPYSGRVRDSFYPIISIVAASQIHKLYELYNEKNKS